MLTWVKYGGVHLDISRIFYSAGKQKGCAITNRVNLLICGRGTCTTPRFMKLYERGNYTFKTWLWTVTFTSHKSHIKKIVVNMQYQHRSLKIKWTDNSLFFITNDRVDSIHTCLLWRYSLQFHWMQNYYYGSIEKIKMASECAGLWVVGTHSCNQEAECKYRPVTIFRLITIEDVQLLNVRQHLAQFLLFFPWIIFN